MEYQDEELWKALLSDRSFRSRFMRDLELQAISSRSAEDLAYRRRDEELIPRKARSGQNPASMPS